MTERDPEEVDLVIIGAGSGNTLISEAFDDESIVLVDDGRWFGGTCLNAGCIPTKMLVRPADVIADAQEAGGLGVSVTVDAVDWPAIRERVFGRTDAISSGGERYRRDECGNVTLVRESVRFEDAHTIATDSGRRFRGRRVVVAAGSRPRVLDAPHPADDPCFHDSDTIMRVDSLPASLAILGGGAIAVEFAHVFAALGVAVTLVTRSGRLLRGHDDDVSALVTRRVAERARVLHEDVAAVERDGELLRVSFTGGGAVEAEAVLDAEGRVPNTDLLETERAGFDLEPDGRLAVDDRRRVLAGGVPVPGVFALGDVSSVFQLKHVANHEARVVQHNLLHPDDPVGGHPGPVPSAVFGHPQVASFGLTEREAAAGGVPHVAVVQEYGSTAYGWALEDTSSFCKLVVSAPDGAILGAHIVGPEASILIQPLVLAASLGHGVPGLARAQYWPHPAPSEVVENALLSAEAALGRAS